VTKTIIGIILYCAFALFWFRVNIRKGESLIDLPPLKNLFTDILVYFFGTASGLALYVFVLRTPNAKVISQSANFFLLVSGAWFVLRIIFEEIPMRLAYHHKKKNKNKDWTKGDYFGVQ